MSLWLFLVIVGLIWFIIDQFSPAEPKDVQEEDLF